jgi:DAACS family dicarboxylate/amino acid:cation (Na+ or H+) symporter
MNVPTASEDQHGWISKWQSIPLYLRIIAAVVLGVATGMLLGEDAAFLETPCKLLLRLLGALAPPLILLAIVNALLHAQVEGRTGLKLVRLLVLNTLVAIGIGLLVANVIKPGTWTDAVPPAPQSLSKGEETVDPLALFLESVPKSLLGPFGDNGQVIGVIFVALAFGIALRRVKHEPIRNVADVVELGLNTMIVVLHWIIEVVPLAVFGIVASIVGVKGFGDFVALGGFVIAVLVALALQTCYYLLRIRFGSWARPGYVLRHTRDALLMAFSTGSSTATMPLTYKSLKDGLGLRERSASLGSLVGANFNNDGTALYEAMSALFVAQMLNMQLTLQQQLIVVVTSVIASVGAAGIPEAGIVTMTLVFKAVGLPTEYILILLTVDWFLDRCRTAINVMGDINVSCLLDGKERERLPAAEESSVVAVLPDGARSAGIEPANG